MSSSGRQTLNLSVTLWAPQAWLVFIERCYFSSCPSLAMLKAFWLQLLWRCCYPLDTCSGCFSQWLSKRPLVISGEALQLIWGGASSQIPNEGSLRPLPTSLHTHNPRWPSQSQTPPASLILTHRLVFLSLSLPISSNNEKKEICVHFLSFCRGDRWHVESADTRQVCTLLNWTKSRMPFKFQFSLNWSAKWETQLLFILK